MDNDEYLRSKAFQGLKKKGFSNKKEYVDRLNEELDTIIECGLSDFMLTTAYTVLFLKEHDVAVGPGRGCLKNDTLVFTKNGFVRIEDIKENDFVMSSDGEYHKVLSTQKYKNDDKLIEIDHYYSDERKNRYTKDHKILVGGRRVDKGYGYKDIFFENKWVPAESVQKNDFLVVPKMSTTESVKYIDLADFCDKWCDVLDDKIIEYSLYNGKKAKVDPFKDEITNKNNRKAKNTFNRYIPLDYGTGFFFGVFSGDGSFPKRSDREVNICCGLDEDEEGYIPEIFKRLGVENFTRYEQKSKNVCHYYFNSRVIRRFMKEACPEYERTAQSKGLFGYKFSQSKEYLLGLIHGIVKSDGHDYKHSFKTTISSSSLNLLHQVRYVLFQLNCPNTIIKHNIKEKREEWKNSKQGYQLNFNRRSLEESPKKVVYRYDDSNIYLPVRSVKEVEKEDFVYDISVEDSYNFLTSNGIVHNSVGGSLIAFCIGITEIDPIKYNLSFARFLNKARMKTSICDIDVDVAKKDRPYILKLLKNEFGENKTCQIINDVYFTDKTAIQDLGRIFGIPVDIRNRLTSLIGDGSAYDVPEVVDFLDKNPKIKELFPKLKGLIRNSSVHAGGVLVSDKPMTDYISVLNARGDNITTCYNGRTCEELGFLKQDLLGLNTLSIIKECLELIGKTKFDFDYDLDDPKVYKTINRSTLGIFQLEGKGAAEYTKRLKPSSFNDIIADLALVRPGAQDSGDAEEFLKVRFDEKEIQYDHPLLKPILKETNGCILYQEQAMEISRVLSGFTDVEADNLRKGIAKKYSYVFTEYKPKFIDGAIANDVTKDIAELIWNKIEKASSYSFNKSHAVGYSLITYQTAYLKTYYPVEFYVSMLNNTESEEKRNRIYNEFKGLGKNIINPDINKSRDICVYDSDNIYLSFALIKGIGDVAINDIMLNQPYKSFNDFMERKTSKVNKSIVKALIEAGAFDCFGDRRDYLYGIIEEKEVSWTKKDELYREFVRIKINTFDDLLSLYNVDEINIDKPLSTIKELLENKEDYKDFYIKLLPSEYKKKESGAFVSLTDGYNNISIFVSEQLVGKYVDELNNVGNPILCHLRGKGSSYSLVSLISLINPEKYPHEYWFYTGKSFEKLKELQEANIGFRVGVTSNISYFVSKNNNNCVRYDLTTANGVTEEGRISVNPIEVLYEGSFLFYQESNNEVFKNWIEVV